MAELKNYDGWGNEVEIGTEVIRYPSYRHYLIHHQGWDRHKVMELGKIIYFKNHSIGVEWADGNVEELNYTLVWVNKVRYGRYGPIKEYNNHNNH